MANGIKFKRDKNSAKPNSIKVTRGITQGDDCFGKKLTTNEPGYTVKKPPHG
jgi:hypothetical protein